MAKKWVFKLANNDNFIEYYISTGRIENCKKLFKLIGTDLDFSTLSEERKEFLNESINRFLEKVIKVDSICPMKILMISEKLVTSHKSVYGVMTPDELAYFVINSMDPELKFLEAYETAPDKLTLKRMCFINFGIYVPALIKIEKAYNDYYRLYEDLCFRDSLKRH